MGLGCLFGHLVHGGHHKHHKPDHDHQEHKGSPKTLQGDDALELLKIRFVKGEISEEEFRRMKTILSES